MPLLIVIASTYAIAENLATVREFEGEWQWFPTREYSERGLTRCVLRGIEYRATWIEHEAEPWVHPDKVRRIEQYGE